MSEAVVRDMGSEVRAQRAGIVGLWVASGVGLALTGATAVALSLLAWGVDGPSGVNATARALTSAASVVVLACALVGALAVHRGAPAGRPLVLMASIFALGVEVVTGLERLAAVTSGPRGGVFVEVAIQRAVGALPYLVVVILLFATWKGLPIGQTPTTIGAAEAE